VNSSTTRRLKLADSKQSVSRSAVYETKNVSAREHRERGRLHPRPVLLDRRRSQRPRIGRDKGDRLRLRWRLDFCLRLALAAGFRLGCERRRHLPRENGGLPLESLRGFVDNVDELVPRLATRVDRLKYGRRALMALETSDLVGKRRESLVDTDPKVAASLRIILNSASARSPVAAMKLAASALTLVDERPELTFEASRAAT
jgi:hypothetical protein